METIAVYWEPVIRTYGFNVQTGLVVCRMSTTPAALGQWGGMFESLVDIDSQFRLVWAHAEDVDRIHLFMLCDASHWSRVRPFWKCPDAVDLEGPSEVLVDLVYFQGPHFGDRYGIMDFTYNALKQQKVQLLAVACSMATVYLVLPAGAGIAAKTRMSAAFEVPMDVRQERRGQIFADRDVQP
jgi:hypothetical protein